MSLTTPWLAGAALALGSGAPSDATEVTLTLEGPVLGIDLCDLDGDGAAEVVVAREDGLHVRALADHDAAWWLVPRGDSRTMAWCSVRRSGAPDELYLLLDGGRVARVRGLGGSPETVTIDEAVTLPAGVFPLLFAGELREPGRLDLVLPHRDGLRLHFEQAGQPGQSGQSGLGEGAIRLLPGPKIRQRPQIDLRLPASEQLPATAKRTLRLPSFSWRDQNGDGHPDLSFVGRDLVQSFWSDAQGQLPEDATLEIDLAELREALDVDMSDLDTANLFRALEGVVTKELRDIDGDGITDLLLREGNKVAVYAGGPAGIDRSAARQVLKTSGNLLAAFTADEDRDGRLDLCMLRIAKLSLAEALVWIVVGGDLEFELFTYSQEEAFRFARQPTSVRELTIGIPPLRSVEQRMQEPARRLRERVRTIPIPLDWDGDGQRDDAALIAADGRHIAVHVDLVGEEIPLTLWRARERNLWRYDQLVGGGDKLDLSLAEFIDWMPFYGLELVEAARGHRPAAVLAAPEPPPWPADLLPPDPGSGSGSGPEDDPIVLDGIVLFRVRANGDERDDLALVQAAPAQGPVRLSVWLAP